MKSDEDDGAITLAMPCRGSDEDVFFHFLHGNVPGHEIDFIYRPEVPQGPLSRQHYSHMARLLRYIEPPTLTDYAFAIGNLSRDDTQHEPGHGGLALVFGLRIHGITDHAGRPDPPFAHALAVIDRALDAPNILSLATAFHRSVFLGDASAEWYRMYARAATETPETIDSVLTDYLASFRDIPRPGPSRLSIAWSAEGAMSSGRITLAHSNDAPFKVLAQAASRIAAVLYRSDIRWSAISSGREADLPSGVTVRLLPRSAVVASDLSGPLYALEDLPEDENAIARELFGAKPAGPRKFAFYRREEAASRKSEEEHRSSPPRISTNEIPVTFEKLSSSQPETPASPQAAAAVSSPLHRRISWKWLTGVLTVIGLFLFALIELLLPEHRPSDGPNRAPSSTATPRSGSRLPVGYPINQPTVPRR